MLLESATSQEILNKQITTNITSINIFFKLKFNVYIQLHGNIQKQIVLIIVYNYTYKKENKKNIKKLA